MLQLNIKVIKNYKYFCHIHIKKTNFTDFGDGLRKNLLENLLGSIDIVSEILTDYENNDKLGFIFPENYYKVIIRIWRRIDKKG